MLVETKPCGPFRSGSRGLSAKPERSQRTATTQPHTNRSTDGHRPVPPMSVPLLSPKSDSLREACATSAGSAALHRMRAMSPSGTCCGLLYKRCVEDTWRLCRYDRVNRFDCRSMPRRCIELIFSHGDCRQRARSSPSLRMQCIGTPSFVTPVAPTGEQKEPECT